MDTYLMMLYVTLEQEMAMKELFLGNGWEYCKPDLRVCTDAVGPLVEGPSSPVDTGGEKSTPATKRLRKGPRTSLPLPRPSSDMGKQAGSEQPGSGKAKSKPGVTTVTHTVSESTANNNGNFPSPLTEQDFDIEGFLETAVIKVEQTNADEADDNDSNVDEIVEDDFVDESQIGQNMTLHEVGSIEQGLDRILSATPGTSSVASTPRTSGRKRKLPKKVAENLEEPVDDNADVAEPETKTNDKTLAREQTRKKAGGSKDTSRDSSDRSASKKAKSDDLISKSERRAICNVCAEGFTRVSSLHEHCKTKHSVEPFKFQCTECPKTFPRCKTLQSHTNKHKNVKPHQCAGCLKKYYSLYSCTRHEAICTILNPDKLKGLACRTCGKRYQSKQSLDNHTEAVHVDVNYKCECEKLFPSKRSLYSHRRKCALAKPL